MTELFKTEFTKLDILSAIAVLIVIIYLASQALYQVAKDERFGVPCDAVCAEYLNDRPLEDLIEEYPL